MPPTLLAPSTEQQSLILYGVTWQQYDALVGLFMDQFPALRMTYLEGTLEIMSTSPEHEKFISAKLGLHLELCSLDPTFFFVTAVLANKSDNSTDHNENIEIQDIAPLSELILLKDNLIEIKDEIIEGQKTLIGERWISMEEMGKQIDQRRIKIIQQEEKIKNMREQIEQMRKSEVLRFERSVPFTENCHNRYWWHQIPLCQYAPPVYTFLQEDDWNIIESWYTETENVSLVGETTIPFISLVHGLIMGNGIQRVVQAGHYAGYSCLLIGFMMKYMDRKKSLFSIDIDSDVSTFTQSWIEKASLHEYVCIYVGDSASHASHQESLRYLGSYPEMVIIDSSHQYSHTIDELNLWYPNLEPGGFIVMHDSSKFAASFDSTKMGGVYKAVKEWRINNQDCEILTINTSNVDTPPSSLVYKDGCGVVLIHKPLQPI